eukprot:s2052_g7.t1
MTALESARDEAICARLEHPRGSTRDHRVSAKGALSAKQSSKTVRNNKEFIRVDFQDRVRTVLEKALQGEETASFKFVLVSKSGEHLELLLNATPRRAANGDISGAVFVGQDSGSVNSPPQALSPISLLCTESASAEAFLILPTQITSGRPFANRLIEP